jgi:DNA-binding NarL/FixJ family response regulator
VIAEEEAPAALADSAAAVIVLSDDPQWTAEALHSGVRAVLPRELTAAEIVAAVQAAAAGLVVLHPRDLEAMLPTVQPARAIEALSPREIEVLGMMAEGISNKEIAARLGISEHTVKFHVASIMGKLHAGTRTEAVMLGVRMGLIMI